MYIIEALLRIIDDMPKSPSFDHAFDGITDIVNYLFSTRLGAGVHVSSYFELFPPPPFSRPLTADNSLYFSNYSSESHILRLILNRFSSNSSKERLSSLCFLGELPLRELFAKFSRGLLNDEVRKSFLTYYGLTEGHAQVDYEDLIGGNERNAELLVMPVEVKKFEEVKEDMRGVKNKLRLRKLKLALVSWLNNFPPMVSVKLLKKQSKEFIEKTYVPMMYIKEEIEIEAARLALPRHLRIREENKAEIRLLKMLIQEEFFSKGIERIEGEQVVIADLLEKSAGLVEFSMESLKGPAATVYTNLDEVQRTSVNEALSCVKAFATHIKNRATFSETEWGSAILVINLHDFNSSLYNLCKTAWRFHTNQTQTLAWSIKRKQQELHDALFTSTMNIDCLKLQRKYLWKLVDNTAKVDVYNRCYKQIYEFKAIAAQCKYWRERIRGMEQKVKHKLRVKVQEDLDSKEKELNNYEKQFAEYKAKLTTAFNSEITKHSADLEKKFKDINAIEVSNKVNSNKEETKPAKELVSEVEERIRKLKLFYNYLLAANEQKHRRALTSVKDEVIRNAEKHEELDVAERREFVIKQELASAQKNMLALENRLKLVQSTLKEKNEALMHFSQAEASKAHRMVELEARLKEYLAIDKQDILLLQEELEDKEQELVLLREINAKNKIEVKSVTKEFKHYERMLQKRLQDKERERIAIVHNIEELQKKIDESKGKTGEEVWAEKYKELSEYCQILKSDNERLRRKIQEQPQTNIIKKANYKRRVKELLSLQASNPLQSRTPARRMYIVGTSTDVYAVKRPLNLLADRRGEFATGRNSSLMNKTTFDNSFISPKLNAFTGSTTKGKRRLLPFA